MVRFGMVLCGALLLQACSTGGMLDAMSMDPQRVYDSMGYCQVSEHRSTFDGTREVALSDCWVYDADDVSNGFRVAMLWTSRLPSEVVFSVTIPQEIKNLQGVAVNTDGVIETLEPAEALTTFDAQRPLAGMSMSESSRQFIAPLELVRRMRHADRVLIRISKGRTYEVGDASREIPNYKATLQKGGAELVSKIDAGV